MYNEMLKELKNVVAEINTYDEFMYDESCDFIAACIEDREREIFDDVPFPTKDRRKGERRREDRENHINRRKAIYRNRLVGKVRKGDCDAWLPYKYEEHYPEGQLADGKGKVFEGDSKFARSFKKINPSWNEEKTDAIAREALKDFGTHGDYNVGNIDYEIDNGLIDTYEYAVELERENILDQIRNVRTIADAIRLASDFGQEIAYNIEYGEFPTQIYTDGLNMLIEETEIIAGRQPLEW